MTARRDATDLSAQIDADHRAVVRERLCLAAIREERERRREIEAEQAAADAEARHAMGAVVWVLAGLTVLLVVVVWATWLWAHGW